MIRFLCIRGLNYSFFSIFNVRLESKMNYRASPELLRQNITHYWKFLIFFYKTKRVGFNFIKMHNILNSCNFYLMAARPSHLKLRNLFIRRLWKKTTFRLDYVSNYKFINLRSSIINTVFHFFSNITSRTETVPKKAKSFNLTVINFRNKKRITNFEFTDFLFKKHYLTETFFKSIFIGYKKKSVKSTLVNTALSKLNFLKLEYTKEKSENRSIKNLTNPQIGNLAPLFRNEIRVSENTRRYNDSKKLKIFSLKTLYIKTLRKKKIKLRKHKIKAGRGVKNLKFNVIQQLKKNKNLFFYFFLKKINTKYQNKIKDNKFSLVWKKLKNSCFNFSKKKIIKNIKKEKQTFSKSNIFQIRPYNHVGVDSFWYIQFLNKFLSRKCKNFSLKINQQAVEHYWLSFQQEFSFPKTFSVLQTLDRRTRIMTSFLRNNKKFYNNFLNIMPTVTVFKITTLFIKQLGIELARTKKHWRVIRGAELIFLQVFAQLRKEPIKGKSGFFGFQLILRGRPNKIARTRKVFFSLGRIKKSEFNSSSVSQTFASSKAQIGSFGLHGLSSTS